jgi:hypothetical protein
MIRFINNGPQSAPPPDREETMMERHQRVLRRLTDLAMQLAEKAQEKALARISAEPEAAPVAGEPDPLLGFARIARTVRQTVMLEAKLEKERKKQVEFEEQAQFTCDLAEVTLRERETKRQVARAVEQAIRAETPDWQADGKLSELRERLDDPMAWHDLAGEDRTTGEIIARFCRELGLDPDWTVWENEDWALAEAGRPGSLFYASGARRIPEPEPPPRPSGNGRDPPEDEGG